MGLYRNIGGVPGQMGLTLTTTGISLPRLDLGLSPAQIVQQAHDDAVARYDFLMSMSAYDLLKAGYWVTTDNGSVFVGDPVTGIGKAYLPIADIQMVENERGTAGTLLMHFNQPVLAKDTAGYGGGASASTGGDTIYSDPIPEVQNLPIPASGPNVINDYVTPAPPVTAIPTTTTQPNNQTQPTTTPLPTGSTNTLNKTLPLVAVAGLSFILLAGDSAIKKRKGLLFVGGLGLLYYSLTKNKTL